MHTFAGTRDLLNRDHHPSIKKIHGGNSENLESRFAQVHQKIVEITQVIRHANPEISQAWTMPNISNDTTTAIDAEDPNALCVPQVDDYVLLSDDD